MNKTNVQISFLFGFGFFVCFSKIFFIDISTLSLSSDTPEEGIGSLYRWELLGIELRTLERTVNALNLQAISPGSLWFFKTVFYV